jgi:hypothetical protein
MRLLLHLVRMCIRGTWLGTGKMITNFGAFQKTLATGLSPEESAKQTLTGAMAARHGFEKINVLQNMARKVTADFTRP